VIEEGGVASSACTREAAKQKPSALRIRLRSPQLESMVREFEAEAAAVFS
jgi:hypothetical protein